MLLVALFAREAQGVLLEKVEAILYKKERQSTEMLSTDIYLTSSFGHLHSPHSVVKTLHLATLPLTYKSDVRRKS